MPVNLLQQMFVLNTAVYYDINKQAVNEASIKSFTALTLLVR